MGRLGSERLRRGQAWAKQEGTELCATCGTVVSSQAVVCHGCGELLPDQVPHSPEEAGTDKSPFKDRMLFYAGLILVALGGPGLSLGSLLHDILRIPIVGNTYDAFGHVNALYSVLGLIVLTSGVAMVLVSLRGGVMEAADVQMSDGRPQTRLPEDQ